jgi:hypothetical protein
MATKKEAKKETKKETKKEKEQPKYKKDQKVKIALGRNMTNPVYKHLIKHDSQHGHIEDEGYLPAGGKSTDLPGAYLYKVRIGTAIVPGIPEQMLVDATSPNTKGYGPQ